MQYNYLQATVQQGFFFTKAPHLRIMNEMNNPTLPSCRFWLAFSADSSVGISASLRFVKQPIEDYKMIFMPLL
jgi:hypothetical protein